MRGLALTDSSRWPALRAATLVVSTWLPLAAGAATPTPVTPTVLPALVVPAGPFDRTLELQGVRFRVQSANDSSLGQLTVTPAGLSIDNAPMVREIDGSVVGAEMADLDVDGSPEVYVYVSSAGSGSYGSLVAFSANRRKSLSDITLPALSARDQRGYQGHDQFAVVENALVRRFPVYRPGDSNAQPSGGVRQLQYKLVKGEAGWRLRLHRRSEF